MSFISLFSPQEFSALCKRGDTEELRELIVGSAEKEQFIFGKSFINYLGFFGVTSNTYNSELHFSSQMELSTETFTEILRFGIEYIKKYQEAEAQKLSQKKPSRRFQSEVEQLTLMELSPDRDILVEKLLIKALKTSVIPDFKYVSEHLSLLEPSKKFQEMFRDILSEKYQVSPEALYSGTLLLKRRLSENIDFVSLAAPLDVGYNAERKAQAFSRELFKTEGITTQFSSLSYLTTQELEFLISPDVLYRYVADFQLPENLEDSKLLTSNSQDNSEVKYLRSFYRACGSNDFQVLEYLCEKLPDSGTFLFKNSPIDTIQVTLTKSCPSTIQFQIGSFQLHSVENAYLNADLDIFLDIPSPVKYTKSQSQIIDPFPRITYKLSAEVLDYLVEVSSEYLRKQEKSVQPLQVSTEAVSGSKELSTFISWQLGHTPKDVELMSSGFPRYAIFPKEAWDAKTPDEAYKILKATSNTPGLRASLLQELRKIDEVQYAEYLNEFLNSENRFSMKLIHGIVGVPEIWQHQVQNSEWTSWASKQPILTFCSSDLIFGDKVYQQTIVPKISEMSEDECTKLIENLEPLDTSRVGSQFVARSTKETELYRARSLGSTYLPSGKELRTLFRVAVKTYEKPFELLEKLSEKLPEEILKSICSSEEHLYAAVKKFTANTTTESAKTTSFAL